MSTIRQSHSSKWLRRSPTQFGNAHPGPAGRTSILRYLSVRIDPRDLEIGPVASLL